MKADALEELLSAEILRRQRAKENVRGFRVAVWFSGSPVVGTYDAHNEFFVVMTTTGERKIFVRWNEIQAIEL